MGEETFSEMEERHEELQQQADQAAARGDFERATRLEAQMAAEMLRWQRKRNAGNQESGTGSKKTGWDGV